MNLKRKQPEQEAVPTGRHNSAAAVGARRGDGVQSPGGSVARVFGCRRRIFGSRGYAHEGRERLDAGGGRQRRLVLRVSGGEVSERARRVLGKR